MTHDYHDGLPGYNDEQILHDGCQECEARSGSRNHGIAHLDPTNFRRAWRRAAEWNQGTLDNSTISQAEIPLLDVLWAVQIKLENSGLRVGFLPDEAMAMRTR
jgi:hypothetical protein